MSDVSKLTKIIDLSDALLALYNIEKDSEYTELIQKYKNVNVFLPNKLSTKTKNKTYYTNFKGNIQDFKVDIDSISGLKSKPDSNILNVSSLISVKLTKNIIAVIDAILNHSIIKLSTEAYDGVLKINDRGEMFDNQIFKIYPDVTCIFEQCNNIYARVSKEINNGTNVIITKENIVKISDKYRKFIDTISKKLSNPDIPNSEKDEFYLYPSAITFDPNQKDVLVKIKFELLCKIKKLTIDDNDLTPFEFLCQNNLINIYKIIASESEGKRVFDTSFITYLSMREREKYCDLFGFPLEAVSTFLNSKKPVDTWNDFIVKYIEENRNNKKSSPPKKNNKVVKAPVKPETESDEETNNPESQDSDEDLN